MIQLTDIHIQDENDLDVLSERISSLGCAICNHITDSDSTAVFLCLTGDLAFSGKENQYVAVGIILEEICSIMKRRFPKVKIYPIFVPGNHDCNFDDENETIREVLLTSSELDITNERQLRMCTSIQKNYFNFVSEWIKKI